MPGLLVAYKVFELATLKGLFQKGPAEFSEIITENTEKWPPEVMKYAEC